MNVHKKTFQHHHDFIKECINRTFEKNFIYEIKFNYGSPFNESKFLSLLKGKDHDYIVILESRHSCADQGVM